MERCHRHQGSIKRKREKRAPELRGVYDSPMTIGPAANACMSPQEWTISGLGQRCIAVTVTVNYYIYTACVHYKNKRLLFSPSSAYSTQPHSHFSLSPLLRSG